MDAIDINKYIDFNKLFLDLYKDHEQIILDNKDLEPTFDWQKSQIPTYNNLFRFKEISLKVSNWELLLDECQITDKEIVWVYGYDFDDANESNPQSTTADYCIIYDRIEEDFTFCGYEQG